jgi:hypothetical protein
MIVNHFPAKSRPAWLTLDLNQQDTYFITGFFRTPMRAASELMVEIGRFVNPNRVRILCWTKFRPLRTGELISVSYCQ